MLNCSVLLKLTLNYDIIQMRKIQIYLQRRIYMKNKIFLMLALALMLICLFAIGVSAATPDLYIEFGARFPGSDEYITVYTKNAESEGNPRIDFAASKFYSDVEFTKEVDISTATGIDFSVTKTYVKGVEGRAPTRMVKPKSPFINCTEVKWFTQENAMDYTIPSTIFYGWSNLKSFDFGNLKKIGDNSFEGCGFETLVIPSSITHLYSRSFAKNINLKSVKFEGPTQLAGNAYAFMQCSSLESVDLGNVPYIGKGTFKDCTSLASIVIPSSVTKIEGEAFQNCTALNSVIYADTPQVKTIGGGAFQNVPASNLSLPSSLTSISGQNAFRGSGITKVVVPSGCTFIDSYTFHSAKITSISFEEGFAGPLALNTGVFQNCTSLTSVVLPEGITSIGQECFTGAIFTSFVLPDSVKTIGGSVFAGCKKLTTFTINPTSSLESIGSNAFKNTSITSFYFPNGLTVLGSGVFSYNENSSLVELVNFENCGVTSIPDGLFRQCYGLKTIKFPYGITSINGSNLFSNCTVDTIILPQTLTTISNAITVKSIGKIIFAAPEGTSLPANAPNTTVEYANYCEIYFAGAHTEGGVPTHTYYDKNGNETEKSYTSTLKIACPCGRSCGNEKVIKTIAPLFVCLGYSAQENGTGGISIGFTVNNTAVNEYEEVMGKTIKYGVFVVFQNRLGNNDVFANDGTVVEGAVTVEIRNYEFSLFELKLVGFTDAQKSAKLAMGAYVSATQDDATEYSYIQSGKPNENEKYCFISYNDITGNTSSN